MTLDNKQNLEIILTNSYYPKIVTFFQSLNKKRYYVFINTEDLILAEILGCLKPNFLSIDNFLETIDIANFPDVCFVEVLFDEGLILNYYVDKLEKLLISKYGAENINDVYSILNEKIEILGCFSRKLPYFLFHYINKVEYLYSLDNNDFNQLDLNINEFFRFINNYIPNKELSNNILENLKLALLVLLNNRLTYYKDIVSSPGQPGLSAYKKCLSICEKEDVIKEYNKDFKTNYTFGDLKPYFDELVNANLLSLNENKVFLKNMIIYDYLKNNYSYLKIASYYKKQIKNQEKQMELLKNDLPRFIKFLSENNIIISNPNKLIDNILILNVLINKNIYFEFASNSIDSWDIRYKRTFSKSANNEAIYNSQIERWAIDTQKFYYENYDNFLNNRPFVRKLQK